MLWKSDVGHIYVSELHRTIMRIVALNWQSKSSLRRTAHYEGRASLINAAAKRALV